MRVSRRTFIASGVAVTGLGLAGLGFAGNGLVSAMASSEHLVMLVVRRRLTFVGINDRELLEFARTYVSEAKSLGGTKLILLRILSPLIYSNEGLRNALPRSLQKSLDFFERKILTQFILSTDLLDEGREDKQRISYLGYYDPLSAPCSNPLTEV